MRPTPRKSGDVPEGSDDMAAYVGNQGQVPELEQPHAIDVPGLLTERLKATKAAEVRAALREGRTIRRGQGCSVRVTAPPALHQATLGQCTALAGDGFHPGRAQGHLATRAPTPYSSSEMA